MSFSNIQGPKRYRKITNHFHFTSTNQCYQPRNEHSVFWIGRTERSGLGNRFCAKRHKKNDKDASKLSLNSLTFLINYSKTGL